MPAQTLVYQLEITRNDSHLTTITALSPFGPFMVGQQLELTGTCKGVFTVSSIKQVLDGAQKQLTVLGVS